MAAKEIAMRKEILNEMLNLPVGTFGSYITEIIIPGRWNTGSSSLKTRDKRSRALEIFSLFFLLYFYGTLNSEIFL